MGSSQHVISPSSFFFTLSIRKVGVNGNQIANVGLMNHQLLPNEHQMKCKAISFENYYFHLAAKRIKPDIPMRPHIWKVASDEVVEKKTYFTLIGSASLQNK